MKHTKQIAVASLLLCPLAAFAGPVVAAVGSWYAAATAAQIAMLVLSVGSSAYGKARRIVKKEINYESN